jgi:hypothetical protein
MANSDFILKTLGKIFVFSVVILVLTPFVLVSLLFVFQYWVVSILMTIGLYLVLGTVSAWIEAPKSFYKSMSIKVAFLILFLLLTNMGCLWSKCMLVFHPG